MYINMIPQIVCRVCGGLKVKEIETTSMIRIEDWFYIFGEGEKVIRIFCSE